MKRILFIAVFTLILLGCVVGQEAVYYGDTNTVAWDDDRIDTDGIAYPDDAVITYEVVLRNGGADIQAGSTTELELLLDLAGLDRAKYSVGVRATYNGQASDYIWSSNAEDTADNVAFYLIPGDSGDFTLKKVFGLGVR